MTLNGHRLKCEVPTGCEEGNIAWLSKHRDKEQNKL